MDWEFYILKKWLHGVEPYGLECAQSVYPVSLPWFAEDFSGVQVWFMPDKLQNLGFYIHFGVWVVGKVCANSGEGFLKKKKKNLFLFYFSLGVWLDLKTLIQVLILHDKRSIITFF